MSLSTDLVMDRSERWRKSARRGATVGALVFAYNAAKAFSESASGLGIICALVMCVLGALALAATPKYWPGLWQYIEARRGRHP